MQSYIKLEIKSGNEVKYESLWWKDIRIIGLMEEWGNCFQDNLQWEIGDGENIRFWEDMG